MYDILEKLNKSKNQFSARGPIFSFKMNSIHFEVLLQIREKAAQVAKVYSVRKSGTKLVQTSLSYTVSN